MGPLPSRRSFLPGGMVDFDDELFLSAHSQTVFGDALGSSDYNNYPFTVEVTVNGPSVLSEDHTQTDPDEFVQYLTGLSKASFTAVPVDDTDHGTHS